MASYDGATSLGLNDQNGRATAAPYYTAWAGGSPPLPDPEPSPTAFYRMRAYDTTLATTVYWNSTSPDITQYGGPGPLTDVVIT